MLLSGVEEAAYNLEGALAELPRNELFRRISGKDSDKRVITNASGAFLTFERCLVNLFCGEAVALTCVLRTLHSRRQQPPQPSS